MQNYKNSQNYQKMMENINTMRKYDKTLYQSSIDINNSPVYVDENNYFNLNEIGTLLNTNYVVDLSSNNGSFSVPVNMNHCKIENGIIDNSACGLLYNAQGLINDISNANQYNIEGFKENMDNILVQVKLKSNPDTFTAIKLSTYLNSGSNLFVNDCKKYEGMVHCDSCDLKNSCEKVEESIGEGGEMVKIKPKNIEDSSNISLSEWYNKPSSYFEDECKKYNGMVHCANCFKDGNNCQSPLLGEISRISSQIAQYSNVDTSMFEDFQCFYNRYRQPLNNYIPIPSTSTGGEKIIVKVEEYENDVHVDKDIISSIYIGSISILGLFIVYKLLDR